MTQDIELGRFNRLKIARKTAPGLFLAAGDGEEVLLPNSYITKTMKIGDEIDVFIYTDSEDRLVATTQAPLVLVGEMAVLEVVDTAKFGAFVDWGLPKDLLVPKTHQKRPFKKGDKRLVRVLYDHKTDRLLGTEKIEWSKKTTDFKCNDAVDIVIFDETPMGYKAAINGTYEGLIFKNEVFEKIALGDRKKAYIKNLREDGKLDLSLQPIGEAKEEIAVEKVLEVIKASGGFVEMTTKSDPELIKNVFGLSKKVYKRTLNQLKEQGKIQLDERGMRIINT